jgi:DNA-directed RNA polymerase subunit alpha
VDFDMELTVEKGRGYWPANEQHDSRPELPVGTICVDALFSPVTRVRYKVEDTRVGQKTNYDKLVLEIWTNGTVTPEMALVESAKILRKHLNPFVFHTDLSDVVAAPESAVELAVVETSNLTPEMIAKLKAPMAELGLGVRASNCLESAGCQSVADIVSKTERDLMELRSFGETSLREVLECLRDHGLSLGMSVPQDLLSE